MHRRNLVSLAALLVFGFLAACAVPVSEQSVTAYEGARLIVGDGRVIENSTLLVEGTKMVQAGRMGDDYVQPSIVKLGITARAKVAAEVEQAGALCVPNAFYIGPAFLAVLHCLAAKEKASPLERMFADFGVTPFARTVPVINGGVEVPQGPGLGADPEDELIARFRV